MEVVYFGAYCFRLRSKNKVLLLAPFSLREKGKRLPKMRADVVLVDEKGKEDEWQRISGEPFVAEAPGEYEVDGFSVTALRPKKEDERMIYLVEAEGVKVCHLGRWSRPVSDRIREELNGVDVLMVAVGEAPAEAAKAVFQLEPKIVLPMAYGKDSGLEEFLKEVGGAVRKEKRLKLKRLEEQEEIETVVLEARR